MISSLLKEFEGEAAFAPFLKDDFDSHSHASNLLQGAVVVEQLGKLSSGINRLEKEIQSQVGCHYEDLLSQTTGVETLEDVLNGMHSRIQTLKAGVERLSARITEPYEHLAQQILLLRRLHSTCELLRRIIHCLSYTEKLQEQLANGPRDIIKAASSLKELDQTGKNVDLSGIAILEKNQLFARKARTDVEKQATLMLEIGIDQQNQSQIATALQVFFNLGLLSSTVDKTLNGFVKNVIKAISNALDINYLTETSSSNKKGGGPGKALIPTIGQSAQSRANLWAGLEKMLESIFTACSKTYQLHKVLAKKRDSATHVCFLDEIYKHKNEDLFTRIWKEITEVLSIEFAKAVKDSSSIRQALEVDYPRLVRLYGDLWKRVEDICTDITLSKERADSYEQEEVSKLQDDKKRFDPEISFRKSLIPLEKAFVSRSLSRLFDAVNLMFSTPKSVPSKDDIDTLLKTITSELNISASDKNLSTAISKSVVKTIQLFCQKCEQLIASEGEASQVIGPPNSSQALNVNIVNQLTYVHRQIERMASATLSHLQPSVVQALVEILPSIDSLVVVAIDPLFDSIKKSVQAIILTIHKEDFSKNARDNKEEPCSLYMKELQKFLTRVFREYIEPFTHSNIVRENIETLCRFTLEFFVRHICLIRPIGEQGKARLATDFAQMETVMEMFIPRLSELGSSYRLIRAFRPLLFQTSVHIASSSVIGEVIPYSTVLHFLFSRGTSSLRSPHQTAGWTQANYSQWLDEHPSELERLMLVKGALEAYVSNVNSKHLTEFDPQYPVMRELLEKGLKFVANYKQPDN